MVQRIRKRLARRPASPNRGEQAGQLIVEILVAFGLASIFIPAIIIGFISGTNGKAQQESRLQAVALMKEAEEAVRSVREASWSNVAINGTYFPRVVGNGWTLSTDQGYETVGEFERSVVITDVSPADPSKKQIQINVTWTNVLPTTISTTLYISRYLGNTTFFETTEAQFDLGTTNGTTVTNVVDGEVQLGAGGKADWCEPSISAITPIDLPKNGVANAVTAIEGKVFAGTGENASGISFARVLISNTDPPEGTIDATFDGYKTNGVFGDGSYGYLATDNNAKEIEMIDLNTIVAGKYQEAGFFNAPLNGNANGVFVLGDYGYMTGSLGKKFYNFNKPGGAFPTDTDGVVLDNTGNKVYVVGNYAYVATEGTTNQLNIVDISTPTNLTLIESFTVDGAAGKDVYINSTGTRAYLATADSSTQSEFFIIDITNKTSPVVLGSYDSSGMSPKGVTVVPGNKAIIVGTGGTQQYQVIDIVNEASPVHCTSGGRSGGLAVATGVNGIASVLESDGDAYSYIITGDASSELKIIEGGPGGKYISEGTFDSNTFDAGSEVAFNRYVATTTTQPGVTSASLQFAGAHAVSGSCSGVSFSYIAPNIDGSIPVSSDGTGFENPARCWRYKVTLTSIDSILSPMFSDITVNYSP